MVNHCEAPAFYPFIIVGVIAHQFGTGKLAHRWVRVYGEKIRQHGLVDLLFESLRFIFVFLALALDAMTKYFVKKYRTGSPRKNRRPSVGISHGSFMKREQHLDHLIHVPPKSSFVRKTLGSERHISLMEGK